MGKKNLAVLTGWPYYRGRGKIHDKYTMHSHFHFLHNCAPNNRNVDISRTVILKTTWNFRLVHKALLKIDY